MAGYVPCSAFSLSHAWIPEQEVLVDSNKEFRADLSRFGDPFLVGKDRNLTKCSLEMHKYICETGIPSTNSLSSLEKAGKN
jgi:hypothetical protein